MKHYGKLGVVNLSYEVKKLWYSRHIDPDPCEPVDTYWPTYTDHELVILQDFVMHLVAITPLNEREKCVVKLCVLENCTLREVGQEMNMTKEQVRQILGRTMRKFRKSYITLTGMSTCT